MATLTFPDTPLTFQDVKKSPCNAADEFDDRLNVIEFDKCLNTTHTELSPSELAVIKIEAG